MSGWFTSKNILGPGKPGGSVAPGPQGGKLQLFHGGPAHLEDDLAGMAHNLGRHVDDPAAHRGGIGLHGHYWPTDILLEGFKEQKSHQHGVIKSRIGRKTQKRQFFEAEILQASMHQFVRAPAVGLGDNPLRQEIMLLATGSEEFIDFPSRPQVGVIQRQRPGKIQQPLFAGHHRPAQEGPTEGVPGAAASCRMIMGILSPRCLRMNLTIWLTIWMTVSSSLLCLLPPRKTASITRRPQVNCSG